MLGVYQNEKVRPIPLILLLFFDAFPSDDRVFQRQLISSVAVGLSSFYSIANATFRMN